MRHKFRSPLHIDKLYALSWTRTSEIQIQSPWQHNYYLLRRLSNFEGYRQHLKPSNPESKTTMPPLKTLLEPLHNIDENKGIRIQGMQIDD